MDLFKQNKEVSYIELHEFETKGGLRLKKNKNFDFLIDVLIFAGWDSYILLNADKLHNSLYNGISTFENIPHNVPLISYFAAAAPLAALFKTVCTFLYRYYKLNQTYKKRTEQYNNELAKIKHFCKKQFKHYLLESFVFMLMAAAAKAIAGCIMAAGGPHGIGLLLIATGFFAAFMAIKDTYNEYINGKEPANKTAKALANLFVLKFISYCSSYLSFFIPAVPHLAPIVTKIMATLLRTSCNIASLYIYKPMSAKLNRLVLKPAVNGVNSVIHRVKSLWLFGGEEKKACKNEEKIIEENTSEEKKYLSKAKHKELRRTKSSYAILAKPPTRARISDAFRKEITTAYEKRWADSDKEEQKIKEENKENEIPKRQASPPIAIPKSKPNKQTFFHCRSAPPKPGYVSGTDNESNFKGFSYGTAY